MKTNILERPRSTTANRGQLLESITKTFAALDFEEENAQVEELKADIRKMHDAIAKAEARCTEISRALVEDRGHDGEAIADALLADASAQDAASLGPTPEDMKHERAVLRSAIKDLIERARDTESQIDLVKGAAFQQLSSIVAPLLDDLAADARAAAERIIDIYAALDAIGYTTRHSGERDEVGAAVAGIMGERRLVQSTYRREVEVPGEIAKMLSALRDKGAALPVRFSTRATIPSRTGLTGIGV